MARTRATTAGQHLVPEAPWAPSRGAEPAAGGQSVKHPSLSPAAVTEEETAGWTDGYS